MLEGGDLTAVLARGHPEHRLRVEARAVGDPLQLPRGVAGVPDLQVGGLPAGPDHPLDLRLEEHLHRAELARHRTAAALARAYGVAHLRSPPRHPPPGL